MVAPDANWITRNAPSLESFGILALLSVLIAVPAFLMIRVLEPGLVLPASSILHPDTPLQETVTGPGPSGSQQAAMSDWS